MTPFHAYLKAHELSFAEFARRIRVKTESVRRYATEDRVPAAEEMRRIIKATKAEVQPNHFFEAEIRSASKERAA